MRLGNLLRRLFPTAHGQQAAAGVAYFAAASVASKMASVAVLPFVTRTVSAEVFAQFVLLRITIFIAAVIADMGLGTAVVRFAGPAETDEDRRSQISTLLFAKLLSSGVVAGILAGAWVLGFGDWLGVTEAEIAIWVLLTFISNAIADVFIDVLRATERYAQLALALGARGLVYAAGIFTFVVAGEHGLAGFFQADIAAIVVFVLSAVIVIGPAAAGARPRWAQFRRLIRFGWPTMVYVTLCSLRAMDRYLIGDLLGLANTAYYEIAAKPVKIAAWLGSPGRLVTEPFIYNSEQASAAARLRALAWGFGGTGVFFAFCVGLLAPEVVAILAPAEYASALVAVPWLLAAMVNRTLFFVVRLTSGLAERTSIWTLATALDVAILLAAMVPLTENLGLAGAGLAHYVGSFVGVTACYLWSRRVWPHALPIFGLALVNVFAAAIVDLVATPAVWPIVAWPYRVGVLVVGLALFALSARLFLRRQGAPRP